MLLYEARARASYRNIISTVTVERDRMGGSGLLRRPQTLNTKPYIMVLRPCPQALEPVNDPKMSEKLFLDLPSTKIMDIRASIVRILEVQITCCIDPQIPPIRAKRLVALERQGCLYLSYEDAGRRDFI